jgi:hypothetical protein
MTIDASSRRAAYRRLVHLGLALTAVVSLWAFMLARGDPILTVHIGFGLLFVGLVVTHLVQRRRTGAKLLSRLARRPSWRVRSVRLAVSDLLLLVATVAVLVTGLWDWLLPHANWRGIHWHAVSGLLLTALLVVHTVRRGRRLWRSQVR